MFRKTGNLKLVRR